MNSSIKPYFNPTDSIYWFYRFDISNEDGREVNRNLKMVSRWDFSIVEQYIGLYKLVLTDADFSNP